jgi:hypothetical protein
MFDVIVVGLRVAGASTRRPTSATHRLPPRSDGEASALPTAV